MCSTDEIRMNQGDFVFVKNGNTEPLIYQELQLILLRNAERFMLGEISTEQHEAVYARCLEIEQIGRNAKGTEGQFKRIASQSYQASARA